MKTRVIVIRHSERDKKHNDPQTLTILGEAVAFLMGIVLRKFNLNINAHVSSPQNRAHRTLLLLIRGLQGISDASHFAIQTDPRLDDFSNDKSEVVKTAMPIVKKWAKDHDITAEQGMFQTAEGRAALAAKLPGFMQCIDELGSKMGDQLVATHGAIIDAAGAELKRRLGEDLPFGMGALGGQLWYCEGWMATYEDGILKAVEVIRLPDGFKAAAARI